MKKKNQTDPIDILVGRCLFLIRNMRGLSQGELGAAIGVTFQQIQKYENGSNRMGASRLFRVTHVLQVPVNWFFEPLEIERGHKSGILTSNNPAAEMNGILILPGIFKLIRAYHKIKDVKKRQAVFDVMSSMK